MIKKIEELETTTEKMEKLALKQYNIYYLFQAIHLAAEYIDNFTDGDRIEETNDTYAHILNESLDLACECLGNILETIYDTSSEANLQARTLKELIDKENNKNIVKIDKKTKS